MSDTDTLHHLTNFISSHSQNSLPSLDSVLSSDGHTATLNGISFSAEVKHNIVLRNEKTLNCSLASLIILLLIGDPANVSYVVYRKTCVDHGVKDPIKVVDRSAVWETFFRGDTVDKQGTVTEDELPSQLQVMHESQEEPMTQEAQDSQRQVDSQDNKKRRYREGEKQRKREDESSNKHRRDLDKKDHRRSHESSAARHQEESTKKSRKERGPMTQEDLLKNLKTVVDKRELHSSEVIRHDPTSGFSQEGFSQHEEKSSQETYRKDFLLDGEHLSNTILPSSYYFSYNKEDEHHIIKVWLSAQGFNAEDIPKDILDKDRIDVEKIMSLEIPVGTSATILQCGMGVSAHLTNEGGGGKSGVHVGTNQKKKDFSMVLDMYNDMIKADEKQKRHQPSSRTSSATMAMNTSIPRPRALGKPIIIVPNAMTSPITLINSSLFFEKSTYMSRDAILKQNPTIRQPTGMVSISRRISPRLGGGLAHYEVMDNPAMKLTKDDWDRVVAVVAQGASWQFKGWKMKGASYSTTGGSSTDISPVDVFTKCFGFYIGFEGSPVPPEVLGWNVKKGMLSKDKRGMDSIVAASFWNGLDEWMRVHKPEYLPSEEK